MSIKKTIRYLLLNVVIGLITLMFNSAVLAGDMNNSKTYQGSSSQGDKYRGWQGYGGGDWGAGKHGKHGASGSWDDDEEYHHEYFRYSPHHPWYRIGKHKKKHHYYRCYYQYGERFCTNK